MRNLKGDDDQEHPLVTEFNQKNQGLLKDGTIKQANDLIRQSLMKAAGEMFGQDALIQFSEASFERIVENLRLLYYPYIETGAPPEHFRELSENSLGYNNLLYLATVIAEMEGAAAGEQAILKVLLIEEPEAHLHPQLQTRVLQYLQTVAKENNIQVIVTTHSPVIAAAVDLDSLVVLSMLSNGCNPKAIALSDCGLDADTKFFIERCLDVTKSTLLFSRGLILVEGIAEALIVPVLAKIFFKQKGKPNKTLDEYGVSVINIGGIFFKQFMQLFRGEKKETDDSFVKCAGIPTRCAGITDFDPYKNKKPHKDAPCLESRNPQHHLVDELSSNPSCRLFMNLKTLEYDLALEGNNLAVMAKVFADLTPTDGPNKKTASDYATVDWSTKSNPEKAQAAFWLYKRVDRMKGEFAQALALHLENDTPEFSIPAYIQDAILWAAPNSV
jgi:putative ATP-dependent endonuclease of OLD family